MNLDQELSSDNVNNPISSMCKNQEYTYVKTQDNIAEILIARALQVCNLYCIMLL